MILASVRPFRLFFHADAVEAPNDVDNKGFCIDFVQQPCTNGWLEIEKKTKKEKKTIFSTSVENKMNFI